MQFVHHAFVIVQAADTVTGSCQAMSRSLYEGPGQTLSNAQRVPGHTLAEINLVTTLDWMLSEISVGQTLEIHQSNLGASNFDIRECVNDVRDQACNQQPSITS